MQSRFNAAWRSRHGEELYAFAFGRRGCGPAHYYFGMPVLRDLADPIGAFVIVIGQPEDFYPTDIYGPRRWGANFYSKPTPHFERDARPHCQSPRRRLMARTRTGFLRSIKRTLQRSGMGHLRWTPGPEPQAPLTTDKDLPSPPIAAYEFMVDEFKEATGRPLAIMYLPPIPCLASGVVSVTNPQADCAAALAEVCHSRAVEFIDMGPRFIELQEQRNVFPRGFANTVPSYGHLNTAGHQAVADALVDYVEEHMDAVFTD
jgi:hypothetical protein